MDLSDRQTGESLAKACARTAVLLLGTLAAWSAASAALTAGDLALICNRQIPASVELAQYYAKIRGVPENRIIELDLPEGELLPAAKLDTDVILPIRQVLTDRGLRQQVRCLVTFYGVPLKLGPRTNQSSEARELRDLNDEAERLNAQIVAAVTYLESAVQAADPSFRPTSAIDLNQLVRRADAAIQRAQQLARAAPDETARRKIATPLLDTISKLGGTVALLRHTNPELLSYLTAMPTTVPAGNNQQQWQDLLRQVNQANEEAQRLVPLRYDPASRKRLRELTRGYLGSIEYLRLITHQADYLSPQPTKALDSVLPLLWVNSYSHKQILSNPLKYDAPRRDQATTLMVMRLDGPQSGTAREIIQACRQVELNGGLQGVFAIDSRGIQPRGAKDKLDAFGDTDQRLRDLAELVRRHGAMSILHDDQPEVFRPDSGRNIALYCGWYSVRKYVPSFQFIPGAVGFHIASWEMMSLRDPKERGWCRGQLNDGIAATLGAVDEPYLGAFPDPLEFFGLLMTGKYTLAETYWLTTPAISWKLTMIGDPLYNPYAQKPALEIKDLPVPLRSFAAPPVPRSTQSEQYLPGHF